MKIKKNLIVLLILFFTIIFGVHNNFFNIKKNFYESYPNFVTEFRRHLFKKESVVQNLKNDFNVKFLPETEFLKLELTKKKIQFNDDYNSTHQKKEYKFPLGHLGHFNTFYIENYRNSLILTDYLGGFYEIKNNELKNKNIENIKTKKIKSNLSDVRILDSLIDNENIYVSYIGENNNCKNLNISVAKINLDNLEFNDFFKSEKCSKWLQAGRMISYNHENKKGMLFTTSELTRDEPDNTPQDESSIFGKILFIDYDTRNYILFSKGHRNVQGIFVDKKLILATEHGPRGGDEINKIIFKENYGWPISSYGEKYYEKNSKKSLYNKSHSALGFKEPLFAFVPSIGISEIIKLPNTFSTIFKDNFILSSLYGRHIYRVKFDKNFERVLFKEKIYIGHRIRDIKYVDSLDLIVLAFEEEGELGIISNLEK